MRGVKLKSSEEIIAAGAWWFAMVGQRPNTFLFLSFLRAKFGRRQFPTPTANNTSMLSVQINSELSVSGTTVVKHHEHR